MEQSRNAAIAISCLVDDKPRFHAQAALWLRSLWHVTGGFQNCHVLVHHIGPPPGCFRALLSEYPVTLIEVAAFGDGPARYCNKLQQLPSFSGMDVDRIILCDVDLAFLTSPLDYATGDRFRAKPVDLPNPPSQILRRLLDAAGFPQEPISHPLLLAGKDCTNRYNFNGGLYYIPRSLLEPLQARWPHWAKFCLNAGILTDPGRIHSDQLGLMLTLLELNAGTDPLPEAANYPLHLTKRMQHREQQLGPAALAGFHDPGILHYHHLLNGEPRLPLTGYAPADRAVRKFNAMLARSDDMFPQEAAFWQALQARETCAGGAEG